MSRLEPVLFFKSFFSPNIVYELKRIIVSSILHAAFHWKVLFIAFKFISYCRFQWNIIKADLTIGNT